MKSNNLSSTWCVNPWLQAHQMMNGQLNSCCLMQGSFGNNILEYINSEDLKKVKEKLLNGEKISNCQQCWDDEFNEIESKRLRDNKTYQQRFNLLFTKKDLLEPNPLLAEYYIRLGNDCNLRCVTCNDAVSTGWLSENKKFNLPHGLRNIISDDDPIWNHIKQHSKHVKLIEFIGGEPFMINLDQQISLLSTLVRDNSACNIELRYHTNGTKIPKDLFDLWQNFKKVTVWFSIDGIGDSFNYLRYPADWDEVSSNIFQFKNLQKTLVNLDLKVTTTLSMLNALEIEGVLDWCKLQNLNYYVNKLNLPAYYNIFNQSTELTNLIKQEFSKSKHNELKLFFTEFPEHVSIDYTTELLESLKVLDSRRTLSYKQCLELGKVKFD
jgi:organic radical activating enzyme